MLGLAPQRRTSVHPGTVRAADSTTPTPQRVAHRGGRVRSVLHAEPYALVGPLLVVAAALVLVRLPWQIDLGIHAATLQRWLHDPTPGVHPMVDVATDSPYYSPYMAGWAALGRLGDWQALTILRFAGVVNAAIMAGGLWYAVRGLTARRWAPVLAAVACGVLWGVETLPWSGFFSATVTTFSMPFPSFFATAVGLWLWGITLRCARRRRVSPAQAAVVAALAALVVLTHAFTAAGVAVLAGTAVTAPLLRGGWPADARRRYLLTWAAVGVLAVGLCATWPFYSVFDLVGGTSDFDAMNQHLYRRPVERLGLVALAVPALVVRAGRHHLADPLLLAAAVLIVVTVAGGLTGTLWLGRLIPFAVITVQIAAAIELTAALQRRRRPPRARLAGRWLLGGAAVGLALGVWAQTGVVNTLWPGTLPDHAWSAEVPLWGTYDWATQFMAYGDVILTDEALALRMAPAYGPFVVASPYPEPTIRDQQARRRADTQAFLADGASPRRQQAILDRYRVGWVIERRSRWRPPDNAWGRAVFSQVASSRDVVLYRVASRSDRS